MFFRRNQQLINHREIAENYMRNLPQFLYDQTLEILEVYREADKKAFEIEQKYQKHAEEELEISFEDVEVKK